jgi:hypothetical protein
MIPQTFDEWKNCIVNDCKINLTKEFADQRLEVYQNKNNAETQKFISLYGEQHLQNIISWFNQSI